MWNLGYAEILSSEAIKTEIKNSRVSIVDNRTDAGAVVYECLMRPSVGIFNCPQPLLPGCELKLAFDRAKTSLALINCDQYMLKTMKPT